MSSDGGGEGSFQQGIHRSGGGLLSQSTAQALDVLAGLWEEVELLADLAAAVEDSSMVSTAKETADLGEGAACLFSEKVHSDLASIGQGAVTVAACEDLTAEVEVVADGREDGLGCGQRRREV